jgi:MFS family permease
MGFVRDPWIMMFVVMVMFGIVNGIVDTSQTTLIQERADYEKQGRIFSALEFCISSSMLIGLTIVTVLTNYFSSSIILYFTGAMQFLIIVIGLIIAFVKRLNDTDYKKTENGVLIPIKPSAKIEH